MRQPLRLFLAINLCISPVIARTSSSVTSAKTSGKSAPVGNLLLDATLSYGVRAYQLAGTPARFEETMMSSWSKEDRKTFRDLMKGRKTLPSVRKEGLALVFTDGKMTVKVEVVDPIKFQLRLNGQLWTYLPHLPLREQLNMLENSVPKTPRETAALWRLLVPDAHAAPWLLLVAGSAVVSTITLAAYGAVSDVVCYGMNDSFGWDTTSWQATKACVEWKDKKTQNLRKNGARLDAIEKQIASDKMNLLAKFEVMKETSCPSNNDGKDRLYSAEYKIKETNYEFAIESKFSPDGKVKEVVIKDKKTKKLLSTLEFDNENYLTCARVPNEAAATDGLTSTNVPICVGQDSLTPEHKAKLDLLINAANFMNMRVTRCTVQSAAEDLANGQEVGAPVKPTNEDSKTPPAAGTPSKGTK